MAPKDWDTELGEGFGRRTRGSSSPYPTPNPAFLSLPRNTSSPRESVLSIHQGLLGWDQCGKRDQDTCKGHRRAASPSPPPTQVPGAGSCQVFPTGAEKPGCRGTKARIFQQKSQDAAAEKPGCSNSSKVTPHQKEKRIIPEGAAGPCVPPQLPAGHFGGVLGLFQSQSSSSGSTLLPPSLESTNPYRK